MRWSNSVNIFDLPQIDDMSVEISDILIKSENVTVERIISRGNTTDWYDQIQNEYVILLQGKAVIEHENGEKINIKKGGTLYLPARLKHRVAYTSSKPPCIWICIFW